MRAKIVFLNWALVFGLGVGSLCVSPSAMAGEGPGSGPKQLKSLRTLDGRQFHDLTIESVDPDGLLFRHRSGVAKVGFERLDSKIRDVYGYREKAARNFAEGKTEVEMAPMPAWADDVPVAAIPPLTLTVRTRTVLPLRAYSPAGGCGGGLTGCGASLASWPWPSHWSRFHPGLAYSLFPCRQLAERDFLIKSGILPRPPGVCTWRLR